MQYNFDEIIDRHNTGSIKWHYEDDTIPLWVADMDFKAAPPILDSIRKIIEHGVLGYTKQTDALYEAIINWHGSRYGLSLTQDEILFSPGVVPSISLMLNLFTEVGDAVLINDPIYAPFVIKTKLNGCKVISSALVEKDGKYTFDFADMEAKIKKHKVKVFLLCNPHNPGGRVWTKEELIEVLELCKKYNVAIVSDEIHQDLTLTGHTFTPFLSLVDGYEHMVVSLTSMTKTFNIAGIKGSMIFVKDKALRIQIQKHQKLNDEYDLNLFAYAAMQSAYEQGTEWLEQVLAYIEKNIEFTVNYFATNLPDIKVMRPEASYLIWLDCAAYASDDKALYDSLRAVKVELNSGIQYGQQGHLKLRINVACPQALLREGLDRVKQALVGV
ncbi:MalY/PatB family protein [Psychrobacter lutiphocae]|uniref:MalY/PatB family protein n=1 Tax=Psychrobacter lutiphocae TaxID=540500 RepID=UPI0003600DA5|nr:MalY/PatB family protein [Psychrobacter lutiphocae]